jgi:hypothetical protein
MCVTPFSGPRPTRLVSARVCEQVGTGAGLDEHIILPD